MTNSLIWAKVYHQAWSYAKTVKAQTDGLGKSTSGKAAATAVRGKFIPNWTSPEFEAFVQDVVSVTDAWARVGNAEHDESCAQLWKRVLDLETEFWPQPSEEVVGLTKSMLEARKH